MNIPSFNTKELCVYLIGIILFLIIIIIAIVATNKKNELLARADTILALLDILLFSLTALHYKKRKDRENIWLIAK